jgi:hypothetical protein
MNQTILAQFQIEDDEPGIRASAGHSGSKTMIGNAG